MTTALYPGTFDPVHFGHIDIIRRAAVLFDRIIVGIYDRPAKNVLFSTAERVAMMETATLEVDAVRVEPYRGLTVEFATEKRANVIIRGLRMFFDFELEYQMALTNKALASDLETMCLFTNLDCAFLSSSMIKEIALAGGDVSELVPAHVKQALEKSFASGLR